MTNEAQFLYGQLRPGSTLQTKFGSRGKQNAKVVKITKNGTVYVTKYRAASDEWTKPVRLYPADIVL